MRLFSLAAVGLVCFVAMNFINVAHAQMMATDTQPPVVMLWIDSSGSMEYLEEEGTVPNCDVANPELTRWAQTLQILTGTFNGHVCSLDTRDIPMSREDIGYPIPHANYSLPGNPPQFSDGVLDILKSQIKFGFGTFDSNPVSTSTWHGSWSFGPTTPAGVNLGARNDTAPMGAMVIPPVNDMASTNTANSQVIQDALWSVVPWGGTPLSPFLSDGNFLFQNEASLGKYDKSSGVGDPFFSCRQKYLVLVTDGKPTLAESDLGYTTSAEAAAQLCAAGIKTYVIGFNVTGQALNVLDEIAMAGSCGELQTAFIADSQQQLAVMLSAILLDILGNPTTETLTVFTNETRNPKDVMYQFNSGYGPDSSNSLNRAGILEQAVYRCDSKCKSNDSTSAGVCEVFSISEALNRRTKPRKMFTSIKDKTGFRPYMPQNGELTADLMGVPMLGKLPTLTLEELPNGMKVCGTQILGNADDPTMRQEYAKQLVGLIRGDNESCREQKRMGAIFHSTPAVHTNMNSLALTDPSFQLYQNSVKDRPSVLYTTTHDGQLHAFRVDRAEDVSTSEYGEELWSYIPNFVLSRLNILSDRFDFILDGIPTIRDVLLYKDDPATPAEILKDRWRSILIVPGGFRTSGLIAMDVTDPEKPSLLWEISPDGRCSPDDTGVFRCYNALLPENNFSGLGFVRGRVDIGTVFVEFNGRPQERSVAIFGGGDGIPGVTNSGKALFIVDIETGKLIKKFIAGGSDVVDTNSALGGVKGLDFDIVGTPTCYNTFPGTVMTRCLVGDAGGQMWHLRFSGSSPNNWKLHFFHDAYNIKEGEATQALTSSNRRPIWEAPAVALHPDGGRLVVAYHTSQIDDLRRLNPLPPRAVSVLEDMVLDDDGRLQEIKATTNWVKYFTEEEGIPTGPPLIYDRGVYQTSYVNNSTDMCLVGEGLLWGHHYLGDDGTSINDVRPAIDADGDPTTAEMASAVSLGEGVPYGVQILSRPSCAGDAALDADTTLDQVGPSKLEFVIQTTGGAFSDDQLPPSGGTPSITRVTRSLQQIGARVFLNSWGNLLE